MARSINTEMADLFDGKSTLQPHLALFVFPSGTYGLWEGQGTLSWNGNNYKGIDRLLGYSGVKLVTGNSAEGASLQIAEIPSDRLSPDWLETIEALEYDHAPVVVTRLIMDPRTYAVAGAAQTDLFKITGINHTRGAEIENGVRNHSFTIQLERGRRGLNRATYARSTDAEHRANVDPGDTGRRHAATAKFITVKFGKIKG